MAINIKNVAQLLTLAAHVMHFTPDEDLIVLAVGGGLPSARIDFPRDIGQTLEAGVRLGEAYAAYSGHVAVLGYTRTEAHRALGALEAVAAVFGEDVEVMLSVVTDGSTWTEAGGDSGVISTEDQTYVAAEAIGAGIASPAASREAHVRRFGPATPIRADIFARVLGELIETDRSNGTTEGMSRLIKRAQELVTIVRATGVTVTDEEASVLTAAASVPEVRDVLTHTATRAGSMRDLDLWADLARRTPSRWNRRGALAMAAFSAWLAGDGATSWEALDTLEAETTGQAGDVDAAGEDTGPLVDMVRHHLIHATNPATWPTD